MPDYKCGECKDTGEVLAHQYGGMEFEAPCPSCNWEQEKYRREMERKLLPFRMRTHGDGFEVHFELDPERDINRIIDRCK